MNGYYFVLTEFISGRFGYSETRFTTEQAAEACARAKRRKVGVKSARVEYQSGQADVDIKKFI
ncbi:MAG: hypothetical protein HFK05_04265 [Clostridia bacterium]|nr:hypothetical protein [Clostridia bacterium]